MIPGDVIYTRRTWGRHVPADFLEPELNPVVYYHYGILTGKDKVVEFLNTSYVQETNLKDFTNGGIAWVDDTVEAEFSRAEIIARAKSHIGSDFNGYSLLNNNCEHFTTYIVRDVKFSRQVSPLAGESLEDIGTKAFDSIVNGIADDLGKFLFGSSSW